VCKTVVVQIWTITGKHCQFTPVYRITLNVQNIKFIHTTPIPGQCVYPLGLHQLVFLITTQLVFSLKVMFWMLCFKGCKKIWTRDKGIPSATYLCNNLNVKNMSWWDLIMRCLQGAADLFFQLNLDVDWTPLPTVWDWAQYCLQEKFRERCEFQDRHRNTI
jgi:hypothetical protein